MRSRICIAVMIFLLTPVLRMQAQTNTAHRISEKVLADKIKGGWAGQTIGVTFGGPYEFRFNGSFIQDYQKMNAWGPEQIRNAMLHNAGLYDDIYMDLTFVDVFEKYGLDAPVDSFASAYAHAGYMLWHANQAGRYNILHGIKAPASGHWKNNPHADDIDFQIEADFAGLMSPAMPQTAAAISDRVGHIMNYGDGWYGGVFVATMYSLAFYEKDIQQVVRKALQAIPAQSNFYKCMADVIRWHAQYPNDWHQTWFEIQKKWSNDKGCPDGVFAAFNIDATINSAYVVLGLLYGKGDFGKTMEIATRAGQDADCNPSTACGVLGTMLGYDQIPAYWKQGVVEAADIPFQYTTMSLNKTYAVGYKHAVENIMKQGGKKEGDSYIIPFQSVKAVVFEESFPGLTPVRKTEGIKWNGRSLQIPFDGVGVVLRGEAVDLKKNGGSIKVRVRIDEGQEEIIDLPCSFTERRHDIYWNYSLKPGKHLLQLEIIEPDSNKELRLWDYIEYQNNGK